MHLKPELLLPPLRFLSRLLSIIESLIVK